MREMARAIGRDPGTVSRELRRNAATVSEAVVTGHRSHSGRPTSRHVDRRLRSSSRTRGITPTSRNDCQG